MITKAEGLQEEQKSDPGIGLSDSSIVAEYCRRTPNSLRLAQEARKVLPSGITHDSRYLRPYSIYVERAAASRKWDVDGNEYVDYTGGHGALLLGHNHPQVVAGVQEQLRWGTHFGASHELEVRWAQLVQKLIPCAERVRFTSSGTEATLLALRLARAYTRKSKILRFEGHFHGWQDHVAFGVSSSFDGSPTPGVLPEVAANVLLAPPGDIERTVDLLDRNEDLAAVMLEPTGSRWGEVPISREFVEQLRQATAEREVVLIFDEVVSGFRCSPSGAQGAYGVVPDLSTLAKILAGGFPGGALVGCADIMDTLAFPEDGRPQSLKIAHQGTYNANPISATAGTIALSIVSSTDACERANQYAHRLRRELNRVLRREGLDWHAYGSFSGFHVFTNPDHLDISTADIESGKCDCQTLQSRNPGLMTKLQLGMLIHGVDIFPGPFGTTSAVHSEEDLGQTVEAFLRTLTMLRNEGEI